MEKFEADTLTERLHQKRAPRSQRPQVAPDLPFSEQGWGDGGRQAAAEEEAQWAVPSVLLWGVRCRRPDPGRGEGYAKAEVQEAAAADRDMPLD